MFNRLMDSSMLVEAAGMVARGEVLHLGGVWGAGSQAVAAALGRRCRAPVLLIVNHLDDADAAADDIEIFTKSADAAHGGPGTVHLWPAWEAQLATDHVSEEVTGERLRLLTMLHAQADPAQATPPGEEVEFIVAPIMALLQPVPTSETLAAGRRVLQRGERLALDDLVAWLTDAGYEHVDQVDRPGEFAHRGGIVDVFPPGGLSSQAGHGQAARLEFFGDELDSIRLFDLDTQRSTDQLASVELLAMRLEELVAPGRQGVDTSAGGSMTHLLDYLPPETIVCLPAPESIRELAEQLYDRIRDDLAEESSPVALRSLQELYAAMDRFARVEMHLFSGERAGRSLRLGQRSLERLAINTAEALTELEELAAACALWIYCDNEAEKRRFGEVLAERHPAILPKATLAEGHISGGFHWPELGLVVVGHHEIYHRYAKVRRVRRVRTGRPIQSLLDLREGDYVVHVGHGIAKFTGLRRMDRDGVAEEYLRLQFADNAVLHVPAGQVNLVQKYIGAKGKRPSLSKLGGGHWSRVKQRVGEAVKDMAAELLRLQAVRQASPGFAYPEQTMLQRQFAEEFLYTETEDQLAALRQIDADMAMPRPMDRLVCGDVGYGKTELAMRAALKVVEAGRQVAVLVPTTVLADQHYRTFTERFADYPVHIDVLSRFRTAKQQRDTLERLALGQVDILIGTHRLLGKDVQFPDLGLVVIDEEQRFGVTHKEHLKTLRAEVDVLTLTATPIPRTLHMAMLGLRDISSLSTPPMDRRSIHTEVCPARDELIRTAILRELNRGGQVFFVHNRVMDINAVARRVQSLVPDARIAVGHGQMPERALEDVMLRFVRSEVDVLVSTTIIESGLDIQTANTMLIHEADRFGLAELHQLRGRVGRYKHRAYCYLLLPERRTVNPVATKRLKAIEDFSDLGAGFRIAMRDLELRGAGNILGPQQSGHIVLVGYELYCQLLEQAVRTLRGEPPPPEIRVHVELGVDAYIPRNYIPAERQRLDVYRRMVGCHALGDLQRLREDIRDAYGPLPEEVRTLLDVTELRILAAGANVDSIVRMDPDVIFKTRPPETLRRRLATAAGTVRLTGQAEVYWRPPRNWLTMPKLLDALLDQFRIEHA